MTHDAANSGESPTAIGKPQCRLVVESARYSSKVVRDLRYDGDLTLEIQGSGFAYARVVFRRPLGFRVMDEGDLTEYWNTYSEPNGWLWEVSGGGWLELERRRPSFWRGQDGALREYLVVDETCVNVLCWEPPEIIDLGTDPTAHVR
ncbi:hypothetical protein ACFXNW_10640 [Nocardia sp. NPDC059180]|uniref:hypothetical protein n=1 Tax=Nocardia sp. NPDC059180 TaxID=3346761 RepID=UPI0036BCB962